MNDIRVLGLDVSTSCIGFACLEVNAGAITVVEIDHYKPIKDGDIFERLAKTRKDIKKVIKRLEPDVIAIEDIVQFMAGNSGAKTIIALAQFNRMIGLVAYDYLKASPILLSVMKIRHGLKIGKDLPPKEDMPELVAKHLNIEFPYLYTKTNKIAPETYDRADATAVALYQSLHL